jgi:alkanesulfonate monooxygenase SsuD/methylene tetrahydromethanopterin reductase-like flavin-dependent oxidoreductase (luciferase family)
MMKSAVIEEQPLDDLDLSGGAAIQRMYQPETGDRAAMIEGSPEEVAARLVEIFKAGGVL